MGERSSGGLMTFFLGGLLGAILGVLYAPRPGEETREILKERASDCLKECQESLESQKGLIAEAYEKGKKSVSEKSEDLKVKIDHAKEAFENTVASVKGKASRAGGARKTVKAGKKKPAKRAKAKKNL